MLRFVALGVVLVLPCVAASAQTTVAKPVSVTGMVFPTPGPVSICQQGETHRLGCTDVFLKSATVDLNQYLGKIVTLVGNDISVTCTVIDVKQVMQPAQTLTMCGSATLGCPVKFNVCPTGAIGIYGLFAAGAPGFFPINLTTGTFLLQPPVFLLTQGIQAFPCSSLQANVPPDPNLLGVTVHMQGFTQDIGPVGPPVLTNSICFTIAGLGLCAPIGC